jgi:hypothetical protein
MLKPKIPYISHHIWLFSENVFLLEKKESVVSLNMHNILSIEKNANFHWEHYIWTDDLKRAYEYIYNNELNSVSSFLFRDKVQVLDIYDIEDHICFDLCDIVHDLSPLEVKTPLCETFLMHTILFQYGGVYVDIQNQIKRYPIELHHLFKIYMPTNVAGVFNHNVIGSIERHPYHNVYKEVLFDLSNAVKNLDQNFISKPLLINNNKSDAESIQNFFLNRTDIVYKHYFDLYGEDFVKNDVYIPYELFFKSSYICNVVIVGDDVEMQLC